MSKIVSVFFLSLFIATAGLAQKQGPDRIDSLYKELNSENFRNREDSNKVNLLKDISITYARENKPDAGIRYGQQCLALAEKLHWKKGVAAANYSLATCYLYKPDYPKALKYSLNQLKEDDAGDKKELYVGYRNVGLIYSQLHDFQKSLTYYFITLKKGEELGDINEIAKITGNISICYEDMGDYSNAREYLFKALRLAKTTNSGAFDNAPGEYPSPPAYDFKVLKVKQELDNLAVIVDTKYEGNHTYKDPADSAKAREFMLREAISNEYDNKARAARSEDERRQLRLEQELKEKQITWEFSQKTAKDSVSREFNLQKLKLEFEEKNRIAESEKNRLEADRKRNDAIAAANLKTSRTYSYAAATVACLLAVIALITVFAYRQNRNDNRIIKKLVNEQEHTIEQRTKELAESNERLAHANKKLVELVQYNAHKMREPLTRVMGAMAMLEYTTADEFCKEITPEIQRAVSDLDNSIMQVISLADETIEQYGK